MCGCSAEMNGCLFKAVGLILTYKVLGAGQRVVVLGVPSRLPSYALAMQSPVLTVAMWPRSSYALSSTNPGKSLCDVRY